MVPFHQIPVPRLDVSLLHRLPVHPLDESGENGLRRQHVPLHEQMQNALDTALSHHRNFERERRAIRRHRVFENLLQVEMVFQIGVPGSFESPQLLQHCRELFPLKTVTSDNLQGDIQESFHDLHAHAVGQKHTRPSQGGTKPGRLM